MAWSTDIDTIIVQGREINRSYVLEMQNGYVGEAAGDYTKIPVERQSWEKTLAEASPAIASFRCNVALKDFDYLDEFDHTNPVQLFTHCKFKCIIYKNTTTGLGGTITVTAGSRNIVGVGTTFLADLEVGSRIFVNAAPNHVLLVRRIVDNLNLEVYQVPPWGIVGAAYSVVDDEREYIFRGTITDKQLTNLKLKIEAFDPLDRLQQNLGPIDMEADILGPYTGVMLRPAPGYDIAGEQFHYEIDPTVLGQTWAENIFGTNRSFVPGLFQVYSSAAPAVDISPAEFLVDEPLGLIIFSQNKFGEPPPDYYIREVYVYQEGTLLLEDVYETLLTLDPTCPDIGGDLGPGFTNAQLRIPLTGLVTFPLMAPFQMTGVGTAFDTELEVGDRVALNADPTNYGIVDTIVSPIQATLRFPYPGVPGANGAAFKSTLKHSYVSLSNINWAQCDGTAADLIRQLREFYADSKGYRIWYDPGPDYVRGELVQIEPAAAIDLGPIGKLNTHATSEEFYSAVAVKGQLGRAKNLTTQAGTTISHMCFGVIPGFNLGTGTGGLATWGGMSWPMAEPPPAHDVLADGDTTTAFMVYANEGPGPPPTPPPLDQQFFDYVLIDFGVPIQIGTIAAIAPNCKNKNQWEYGISYCRSDAVGSNLGYLLPETYQRNIKPNDTLEIDCELSDPVQYLLVRMRPIKWVSDGGSRAMGLRELIIYGSSRICQVVCIQNHTAPGPPPYTEGVGGHFIGGSTDDDDFITDYYPNLVTKMWHRGHQTLIDDSGLVFSEAQAVDRAYLLLNEVIRLYREVAWVGAFDPRIQLYDTVQATDDYRTGAPETLQFMAETISLRDGSTSISGREYGAGVLE